VRERRPRYLVSPDVLRGLRVLEDVGAVPFRFRLPSGEVREVQLPVRAPFRDACRNEPWRVDVVDDGRVVHATYNVTRGETAGFASEVERLSRSPAVGLVVFDLRRNSGGDNRTYGPLLTALERIAADGVPRLAVLISRVTFSAAMQLVVDLERRTPAVFVGEPTGGSPNHYGDAEPVQLPASTITAHVATIAWATAGAEDSRSAKEPDVRVDVDSASCFSGRDATLAAAIESAS
jgi:hypothetical protein